MLLRWVRTIGLSFCRVVGGAHGLLQRKALLHLVLLAAIAGALRGVELIAARFAWPQFAGVLTPWNVLSVWAFGLVAWSIVQARRRLVIATFDDFSSKQAGVDAQGFGVLVATELSRLGELFGEFETGRTLQATPERLTPLDATFQTDSPSKFLEKAVSSETSFSLGPFKVPLGVVLSLVGRLVQGPLLTGQVHRDCDQRVVTARLAGSRRDRTFRIVDPPLAGEGDTARWRPAGAVARELACRIFADIALGGSVTWQALDDFATGVLAYRNSLRAPQSRDLQMREAERRLLAAIAEDPRFDLAYYDLGVVYAELGQLDSAAIAFTRAIAENAGRWSAHYALAVNNHVRAKQALDVEPPRVRSAELYLSNALDECEQALQLAPDAAVAAQVLSLKATVLWWRAWRMWSNRPEAMTRELRDAGRTARAAVQRGWWVLCLTELGVVSSRSSLSAERRRARQLASRYFHDLSAMAMQFARLMTVVQRASPQQVAQIAEADAKAAAVRQDLEAAAATRGRAAFLRRAALRVSLAGFVLARGSFSLAGKLQRGNAMRWLLLRHATHALRQARALTPESAEIHHDLGVAYLELGRDRAARNALQVAARLSPTSSGAWGFLAHASTNLCLFSRADEAGRRFFESLPATKESVDAMLAALDAHAAFIARLKGFAPEIQRRARLHGSLRFRLWTMWQFMRYAYQLAERSPRSLALGTARLQQVQQDPAALDAILAAIDKARERIGGHLQFQADIKRLRGQARDAIEPLKALLEARLEAGEDWEAGHAGHALSDVYSGLEMWREAEETVRRTIAHLETTLPGEIHRRALYTLLSRILRKRGMSGEALEQARAGIVKDPVSPFERIELGRAHFELAEYELAQAALEDAVRLKPDDPRTHMEVAWSVLMQLDDVKDRAARARYHDRVASELRTALELFRPDDPERNRAQLLFAKAYSLAGRHVEAARELRGLERRGFYELYVEILLADECLAKEDWDEAERRFRKASAEIDRRIAAAEKGVNEPVEDPIGENLVLGTASAYARLGIAATLAEREIYLDEAFTQVELARRVLSGIDAAETKNDWLRACSFHEGSILFKQDHLDEAIVRLESALGGRADAETYFALANALVRKSEMGPARQRVLLLRRSRRYYEEARKRDMTGQKDKAIDKAIVALDALAASSRAGAVAPSA